MAQQRDLASDPIRNFKFLVTIPHSNMLFLGFSQVSGFSIETGVISYREGGHNTTERKMPGQSSFNPLSLVRGMHLGSDQGWNWFKEIFSTIQGAGLTPGNNGGSDPANFRTDLVVSVLSHPTPTQDVLNASIKARFKVFNAWPMQLSYGDLDAGGNGLLIEQLVLAHEGWDLTVDKSTDPLQGLQL